MISNHVCNSLHYRGMIKEGPGFQAERTDIMAELTYGWIKSLPLLSNTATV